MKTITIRIPESLDARLKAAAGDQGRSMSELTREALEQYFLGATNGEFVSCYDSAPHLSGCLDSETTDLASNPKHMEGFGR